MEKRLSKHKMTTFSKILSPPWLRLWLPADWSRVVKKFSSRSQSKTSWPPMK